MFFLYKRKHNKKSTCITRVLNILNTRVSSLKNRVKYPRAQARVGNSNQRDGKPESGRPWHVEDACALFDNLLFPGLAIGIGAIFGLGIMLVELLIR